MLRGYEIGPGLDGGWEEYKESLPTLDADLCLEYAEVRRNIDPYSRKFILLPNENLQPTPLDPVIMPENLIDLFEPDDENEYAPLVRN